MLLMLIIIISAFVIISHTGTLFKLLDIWHNFGLELMGEHLTAIAVLSEYVSYHNLLIFFFKETFFT